MGKKSPKRVKSGASGNHEAKIPRPAEKMVCEYAQVITDGSGFGVGLADLARHARTSHTCDCREQPVKSFKYAVNRTGQFCKRHGSLLETYDIMTCLPRVRDSDPVNKTRGIASNTGAYPGVVITSSVEYPASNTATDKIAPTAQYLQKCLIAKFLRLDENQGMLEAVRAEKRMIAAQEMLGRSDTHEHILELKTPSKLGYAELSTGWAQSSPPDGVKAVETVKAVRSPTVIASKESYKEFQIRLGCPDSPALRSVFREQVYSPVSMKPIRPQTPSQGRMIGPNPGTFHRSEAAAKAITVVAEAAESQSLWEWFFPVSNDSMPSTSPDDCFATRTDAAQAEVADAKFKVVRDNSISERYPERGAVSTEDSRDDTEVSALLSESVFGDAIAPTAQYLQKCSKPIRDNKAVAKAAVEASVAAAKAAAVEATSATKAAATKARAPKVSITDGNYKAVRDNFKAARIKCIAAAVDNQATTKAADTAANKATVEAAAKVWSGSLEEAGDDYCAKTVTAAVEAAAVEVAAVKATAASKDRTRADKVEELLDRRAHLQARLHALTIQSLKQGSTDTESQFGNRPSGKTLKGDGEDIHYLDHSGEGKVLCTNQDMVHASALELEGVLAIAGAEKLHDLQLEEGLIPVTGNSAADAVIRTDITTTEEAQLRVVSRTDARIVEALFRKRLQRSGDPNRVKAAEAHPGALTTAFGKMLELSLSIPKLTQTSQNELTLRLSSRTSMVAEAESTSAFENEYTQVTADMAAKANSKKTAVLGAAADAADADNAEADADTAAEAAQVWAANVDWVSPTALQGAGEANSANAVHATHTLGNKYTRSACEANSDNAAPPTLFVVAATQAIEVAKAATLQAAAAEVQATHVIEVAKAATLQATAAEGQATHAAGDEAIRTSAAAVDVEDNFNASFEDTATDAAKVTGAEKTTEAEAKLAGTNTVVVAMLDHAGLPIAKNTNAVVCAAGAITTVDTDTVAAKAITRAEAIDAEAKLTLDREVPSVDIAVSTTNEANPTTDAARLTADEDMFKTADNARGNLDNLATPTDAVGVAVVDEASAYASEADLAGASMVADQTGWWIENVSTPEVAVVTGFSDAKAELKSVVAAAAELKSVVAGAVGAIADEVELKYVVDAGTCTLEQAGSLTWKDTSLVVAAAEAIAAKAEFKSGVIKGSEVKTANIVHQPTPAGWGKNTPTTADLSNHMDCFREEILPGSKCLKRKTNSQDVVVGTVGTIAKQPEFKLVGNVSASHASAENATEAKSNLETKAVDVTTNARGVQIMEADSSANKAIDKAITAGVEASALSGNKEASTVSIIRAGKFDGADSVAAVKFEQAALPIASEMNFSQLAKDEVVVDDIVYGQNKAAERTGVKSRHKVSHTTSHIARLNKQFGKRPAGDTLEGGGEYTCFGNHDYPGYPSEDKALVIKQGVRNLLELVFKDETVQVQVGEAKRRVLSSTDAAVFTDKATAEKGKRLVVQPTKVPVGEAKLCVLSVADGFILADKVTVEHSAHAAPAFGNVYTQVTTDVAVEVNYTKTVVLGAAVANTTTDVADAATDAVDVAVQVTVDRGSPTTLQSASETSSANAAHAASAFGNEYTQVTADVAVETNYTKSAVLGSVANAAPDTVVDAAVQVPTMIVDRGSSTTLQSACEANFVNAGPPTPTLAAPSVVAAAQAVEAVTKTTAEAERLSHEKITSLSQVATRQGVAAPHVTGAEAQLEREKDGDTTTDVTLAEAIDAEAKLALDREAFSVSIAVATTNEANPTSNAARLIADEDMFKAGEDARGNADNSATPTAAVVVEAVAYTSEANLVGASMVVDQAVWWIANVRNLEVTVAAEDTAAEAKLKSAAVYGVGAQVNGADAKIQVVAVAVNGARATRTDDKFNVIVEPHLANATLAEATTNTLKAIATAKATGAEAKFAGANFVVAGKLVQAGSIIWKDTSLVVVAAGATSESKGNLALTADREGLALIADGEVSSANIIVTTDMEDNLITEAAATVDKSSWMITKGMKLEVVVAGDIADESECKSVVVRAAGAQATGTDVNFSAVGPNFVVPTALDQDGSQCQAAAVAVDCVRAPGADVKSNAVGHSSVGAAAARDQVGSQFQTDAVVVDGAQTAGAGPKFNSVGPHFIAAALALNQNGLHITDVNFSAVGPNFVVPIALDQDGSQCQAAAVAVDRVRAPGADVKSNAVEHSSVVAAAAVLDQEGSQFQTDAVVVDGAQTAGAGPKFNSVGPHFIAAALALNQNGLHIVGTNFVADTAAAEAKTVFVEAQFKGVFTLAADTVMVEGNVGDELGNSGMVATFIVVEASDEAKEVNSNAGKGIDVVKAIVAEDKFAGASSLVAAALYHAGFQMVDVVKASEINVEAGTAVANVEAIKEAIARKTKFVGAKANVRVVSAKLLKDDEMSSFAWQAASKLNLTDGQANSLYATDDAQATDAAQATTQLKARAVITVGLFWPLCVSKFAKQKENERTNFISKRKDVSFFKNGKLCPWYTPDVDAVELFIPGSEMDQTNQGTRRRQYATGEAEFCPVKCMVRWFAMTDGSTIQPGAPLFSIPLGTHGDEWVVLRRAMVVSVIKSAATECNLPTKLASTHSIRISGATALLLAGVPAETVQIIGRWVSNVFQRYTRFKLEIMQGISAAMARTVFTINSK